MLEPWNDFSLLPPPVQTLPHNSVCDVVELKHIIKNMMQVLNKQSPLYQESVLMSRFLYKFDKKFRNDVGYRTFKKVNTGLNKLLKLYFLKVVENFDGLLCSSDSEVYLPSKQMLEYFLVKILTFSKLLLRINVCSKQSSVYYLDRIKRGESHWMSLLPYALLSRIWSISLILLQHSCRWYSDLLRFLNIVKQKGLDFLPSCYQLPLDLHVWLDMENLDSKGRFQWTTKHNLNIDTKMLEGDDDEDHTFESILSYVSHINEKEVKDEEVPNQLPSQDMFINRSCSEDCGEGISRESFKGFFKTPLADNKEHKVQVKEKNTAHSPAHVVNKKSLLGFIAQEESLRYDNSNQALTSHLSFMQWQVLKSALTNLNESLGDNRKIKRKFQKIWKEKCMDIAEHH